MASDVAIRDARPAEQEAIVELTLAAYREYAAQMPAHWEAYRDNIVATLGAVRPAEQIVAERAGVLSGAVLLYPAGTTIAVPGGARVRRQWPEMRLLAVVPAARRLGIGEALVHECRRRAEAAGNRVLSLHTTPMMRAARAMYQRLGFVRAPELDIRPAPDLTIEGYRLELVPGRPNPDHS